MFDDNALFKSKVFKNAYDLYHGGFLKVKDVTKSTIVYEVEDLLSGKLHLVSLKYDFKTGTCGVDCTCTIQALKSKLKPLCSHIVGCMMHAGFQLGRKKR